VATWIRRDEPGSDGRSIVLVPIPCYPAASLGGCNKVSNIFAIAAGFDYQTLQGFASGGWIRGSMFGGRPSVSRPAEADGPDLAR
jgi:hypothetical protein